MLLQCHLEFSEESDCNFRLIEVTSSGFLTSFVMTSYDGRSLFQLLIDHQNRLLFLAYLDF